MGLFSSKPKMVQIDTNAEFKNNITNCLEMYKRPVLKDKAVYLKQSEEAKFVNIYIQGVADVAGVITRDEKNVVVNIGLYIGRGCLNAFTPDSEEAVARYNGQPLEVVPAAYK